MAIHTPRQRGTLSIRPFEPASAQELLATLSSILAQSPSRAKLHHLGDLDFGETPVVTLILSRLKETPNWCLRLTLTSATAIESST